MTMKMNTGLKNNLLDDLAARLGGGVIRVFSGAQPSSSDLAETGTHLLTITLGAGAFVADTGSGSTNGLTFDAAADGVLSKAAAETWAGDGIADGIAGWFRFYPAADGMGASSTKDRYDGYVSTSGAELNLSSTTVVTGARTTVTDFDIDLSAN